MTLANSKRRNDHSGDGSTVAFAVTFRFLEAGHLRVVLTDANGGESEGVIASVSGVGDANGGVVTLTSAPAAGVTVTILGSTPLTQETDFETGGAMPEEVVEVALDKITMQQQEQAEKLDRAVSLPEGYSGDELQFPVPQSGKGIKFDDSGKLVTTDSDIDAAVASALASAQSASESQSVASSAASQAQSAALIAQQSAGVVSDATPTHAGKVFTASPSDIEQGNAGHVVDAAQLKALRDATTAKDTELTTGIQNAGIKALKCKRLMNTWQPSSCTSISTYWIMEDGSVRASGYTDGHDSLAQGYFGYHTSLPLHISRPHGLAGTPEQVVAGRSSFAILTDEGDICMWGFNGDGQLGDGSTTNRKHAVLLSPVIGPRSGISGRKVIKLVHSSSADNFRMSWYALCENGEIWSWGYNGYGQLGVGSTSSSSTPVQMVGTDDQPVTNAKDVVAAGGQYGRVLVVLEDNSVLAAGYNHNYGLGLPANNTNYNKLTAPPNLPSGVAVKKIDAHGFVNVGAAGVLYEDGRLFMAGYGAYGIHGVNTTNNNKFTEVTSLSGNVRDFWLCGGNNFPHAFATLNDGSFYAWGLGNVGQLGNSGSSSANTTPVKITVAGNETPNVIKACSGGQEASGSYYQTSFILTQDGRCFVAGRYPYGWGGSASSLINEFREWLYPTGSGNIVDIVSGGRSSSPLFSALDKDGVALGAGYNSNGETGLGHTNASTVPQKVRF
ncbi:hypothetical protein [Kiloniella sp. b19]|uniref:hypothetical protein n=1 Tax=Kiloniella sp. GXU_MW_B19 TaxID=3141326 RepID=UPI0031D30E28